MAKTAVSECRMPRFSRGSVTCAYAARRPSTPATGTRLRSVLGVGVPTSSGASKSGASQYRADRRKGRTQTVLGC